MYAEGRIADLMYNNSTIKHVIISMQELTRVVDSVCKDETRQRKALCKSIPSAPTAVVEINSMSEQSDVHHFSHYL